METGYDEEEESRYVECSCGERIYYEKHDQVSVTFGLKSQDGED